jgi:hypothetical protein
MIGHLVKFIDSFDMRPDNCFFFLEDPNVTINLGIAELFVLEVPKRCWNLILAFVVKKDEESAGVVVDFKLRAHGLFHSADESAGEDDVVYRVSFEFADVVGPGLRIHNHAHSHRGKHFRFPRLVGLLTALKPGLVVVTELLGVEEAGGATVGEHLVIVGLVFSIKL